MNIATITFMSRRHAVPAVIALAAAVLAFDPVLWLIETWRDPAYDSRGFTIFAIAAGLFAWSVSSPRAAAQPVDRRLAYGLLALTAVVRLAGQVLAINTLGAIALVVDVYAVSLLCGLASRERPASPFWLAVAFAFSLPLERIVQRTIGYGLQHVSADGACKLLGGMFNSVVCEGLRIVIAGKDVLIDLPCSGARTSLLLLFMFAVCAAVCRPTLRQGLAGAVLTLAVALGANVTRITLLATGMAWPDLFFGIDVMAQPWHNLLGQAVLGLACVPFIIWCRYCYRGPIATFNVFDRDLGWIPDRIRNDGWWLEKGRTPAPVSARSRRLPLAGALACLGMAVVIVTLPRKALDVAKRDIAIALPSQINGEPAEAIVLSDRERAYFIKYGGAAAKARYGDQTLLVVRTSAPLRHLHAPDDCLRGLGLDVAYLGARFAPVPTATYRATTNTGQSYRIDVTFMSDTGRRSTNVAEAVWLWLQGEAPVWTAVQRITPVTLPEPERAAGERAIAAYFNLSYQPRRPLAAATPAGQVIRSANNKGAAR